GRQWIFLAGEYRGNGTTADRCLRAGFASGARVESRRAGARTRRGATCGATAHAAQAALPGGTHDLSAKKRDGGTGAGSAQGAAWDAAIPVAWVGESSGGVHLGRNGVEPHANLARQAATAHRHLATKRVPRPPRIPSLQLKLVAIEINPRRRGVATRTLKPVLRETFAFKRIKKVRRKN